MLNTSRSCNVCKTFKMSNAGNSFNGIRTISSKKFSTVQSDILSGFFKFTMITRSGRQLATRKSGISRGIPIIVISVRVLSCLCAFKFIRVYLETACGNNKASSMYVWLYMY